MEDAVQSIIYLFVSPSGRAYAGRHTCQHEGWPRRGSGALPSGYRGSGKLWANVTRRHGPAIRWIILRRFGPDAAREAINEAERRAVRLARAKWGERCMNIREGGDGYTSGDVRALWGDPAMKEQMSAAMREAFARPDVKARRSATEADPEVKARRSAANKAAAARPEVKAKHMAALSDPAVKARLSAASKAAAARPEVKAKMVAANKAKWADPEWAAAARARLKEAADRRSAAKPKSPPRPPANRREVGLANWTNPEYVAKQKAAKAGAAAKRSATCAARKEATAWHSPFHSETEALQEVEARRAERRAVEAAHLQELWADPAFAEAARARHREVMSRPEVKARHKAAMPAASAKRSATCAAKREATAWHSPFHNKE